MDEGPAEKENVSQRLAAFAFAFLSEGIAASAFGFGAVFCVGAATAPAFLATTDATVAYAPFSRSCFTSFMNPTPSVGE